MAEEFVANFSVENNEVNANFSIQENNNINASFTMTPLDRDHNELYNRDIANQHPISAITDLEARLTALENQDKTFVYEQAIAADTWVINHTLDKFSSITIVDSAGNIQIPDEITYNSQTQITVTFLAAFAGKAILN